MPDGLIVYKSEQSVEHKQSKSLVYFFTEKDSSVHWEALDFVKAKQYLMTDTVSILYILPESRELRKELLQSCKCNPKIILLSQTRLAELLAEASVYEDNQLSEHKQTPPNEKRQPATLVTKNNVLKKGLIIAILMIIVAAFFYFSKNLW